MRNDKLLAPREERGADAHPIPRQVKTARRLVVPTLVLSATPRAGLGLDRRGKLASAARAAKEGLDKEHGIFECWQHTIAFPTYQGGAAKRQHVGRLSIVELSRSSTLLYGVGSRMPCCLDATNRAWFEGSWCCMWFHSTLPQPWCR